MACLTFWPLSYFLSSLSLCHQHHSHYRPKQFMNLWIYAVLLQTVQKLDAYSRFKHRVNFVCPQYEGILMPSSTWNFHRFEKYLAVKQKYVTAVNCHPSYLLITQVSHYLRVAITDPQTVLLGFASGSPINTTCPPLPSLRLLRVGPTDTN